LALNSNPSTTKEKRREEEKKEGREGKFENVQRII
jgi:hypothetical protein